MRKFLFLSLLAISSVACAQTTTVNKLKITNNAEDNAATRVLVQNATTKEVRWVLKSSLGGGGGGATPNFQQVTNEGGFTTNAFGIKSFMGGAPLIQMFEDEGDVGLFQITNPAYSKTFQLVSDRFNFSQGIDYSYWYGPNTDKPSGTYVLATNDDITMQTVVNNNGTAQGSITMQSPDYTAEALLSPYNIKVSSDFGSSGITLSGSGINVFKDSSPRVRMLKADANGDEEGNVVVLNGSGTKELKVSPNGIDVSDSVGYNEFNIDNTRGITTGIDFSANIAPTDSKYYPQVSWVVDYAKPNVMTLDLSIEDEVLEGNPFMKQQNVLTIDVGPFSVFLPRPNQLAGMVIYVNNLNTGATANAIRSHDGSSLIFNAAAGTYVSAVSVDYMDTLILISNGSVWKANTVR